jgi:hypothetical protein
MNTLIIVLLLIFIYFIFRYRKELFKVVAYNSDNVPSYEIETPYNTLVSILQKNLDKINTNLSKHPSFSLAISQNYINDFTKYPEISEFPFNSLFKNILDDRFISQLSTSPDFVKSKFEIFTNPSNIYYREANNLREYVFNVILHNQKLSFSTKLLVYVTIDNINSFMINENIITQPNNYNVYINHIDIQPFQDKLSLIPFSNDIETYYLKNTNKLYLFKPFLTNEIYHNKTKIE